ncbi:MAG: HU family DNA-binding protein [Staphylococcus epidermidis]|nr:HU family DNA-binding protein [Staphylococcus epidermidis]
MNKTDLINAVAEQADLTKKEAGSAVDAVFESIQNSLAKGEKVQLIGFGNCKVPAFKAGKALKDAVK